MPRAETFQTTMNKITRRQFKTVDVLYSSEDQLEGAQRVCGEARPGLEGTLTYAATGGRRTDVGSRGYRQTTSA